MNNTIKSLLTLLFLVGFVSCTSEDVETTPVEETVPTTNDTTMIVDPVVDGTEVSVEE